MEFFDSPYKTKILDDTTGSFLENYIELNITCDAGATVTVNRYESGVVVDTIDVGEVTSGSCVVNLPCFGEWEVAATLNGTTIYEDLHHFIDEVKQYESDVTNGHQKLNFTRLSEWSNLLSPAYSQDEFLLGVSGNLSKYSFSNNSIISGSCTQQEITEATTNTLSWYNGTVYSPDIGYDDILLSNNMKIKNALNGALFSCLDNTEYTRFKNFFVSKIFDNRRPYIVPVSNSSFVLIYYSSSWYASLYDISDLTSSISIVSLNSTATSYPDSSNYIQISKVQNSSGNFLIIWKRSKLSNDVLYYDVLEILSNSISLKNSNPLSISLTSGYYPRSFPLQYNDSFILFASAYISNTWYTHIFKLDMLNDFSFSVVDDGAVSDFPSQDIMKYDFIKMADGYVIAYDSYNSVNNNILIYILEITSNFTCSLIHSYTSYILAEAGNHYSDSWVNPELPPTEGPYPMDWQISWEELVDSCLSKINYNTFIFLYRDYYHLEGYYAPTVSGGDFYDVYSSYTNGYILKYRNGQLFY